MISYHTEGGVTKPKICTRRTSAWVRQVAASHGKTIGEIAYIFCSDEYILQVNNQYLGHDYYTDVITFDYSEGNQISGDIFISLDTVHSNSVQFQTEFIEELERIIIHGILHLCGFKDKQPDAKAEMTRQEDRAIALLEKPISK
ncbi:MAG: rRNA maturation RNase YbeY [Paludibacteraceae bacterium]|nr:rRNA maturation RNase YbeY [Paludibacteraceae bacterium]